MSTLGITALDVGVGVVVLISALLAFGRGFIHEIMSVGAIVGAIVAVIFGFPLLKPLAQDLISSKLIANVATGAVIFVVALVLLSILTRNLVDRVRGSALNAVDRSLGFAFGLARGALLVCLAYIPVQWAWPAADRPGWLTDARMLPLIQDGADYLRSLVPADVAAPVARTAPSQDEDARKSLETEQRVREIMKPEAKGASAEKSQKPEGYSADERRQMDHLIEKVR